MERSVPAPASTGSDSGWAGIGSGRTLRLVAIEVWLLELPFVRPVVTAVGTHRNRPLALVKLAAEAEGTVVEGWGECAALADTTYDAEDAAGAFATLTDRLGPLLVEAAGADGGRLPAPSGLEDIRRAADRRPLAFAALEMAVADAHLRAESRSLAAVLGVEGRSVELGAVVGRPPSVEALLSDVGNLVDQGYRRVKMKVGPGWDVAPLEAVTGRFPGLAVQVDANGAYATPDTGHLVGLDRFGLLCVEQPFDRADLEAHVRLAGLMATPVSLDEGVDSVAAVRRALDRGACSVVGVKPSRLGGLGAALDLVAWCTAAGVPLWMGGMFESGYARGVNTTLAALPGFRWPGDLSPSPLYLAADIVPPWPSRRDGPDGARVATVPSVGGMGVPPEPGLMAAHIVRHRHLRARSG